jgi:hypothetical protein
MPSRLILCRNSPLRVDVAIRRMLAFAVTRKVHREFIGVGHYDSNRDHKGERYAPTERRSAIRREAGTQDRPLVGLESRPRR